MKTINVIIGIAAAIVLFQSIALSQESEALTIDVSGAYTTDDANYYLVQIPAEGGAAIPIGITGGGSLPELTDDMKCVCSYNGEHAAPDPDGKPYYTFRNDGGVGDLSNTDYGIGQVINWNVDSNTAPGEYVFSLTDILQDYKSCDSANGWNDGNSSAVQENSQESRTITILAFKITSTCEAGLTYRKNIGAGEIVNAEIKPSMVVGWHAADDNMISQTANADRFRFHALSHIPTWLGYVTTPLIVTIKGSDITVDEFNVIIPNHETAVKTYELVINPPSRPGAGMDLEVTVGPTDVKFSNIICREEAGPPENVIGYWVGNAGRHKNPAGPTRLSSNNIWGDEAACGNIEQTAFPPPYFYGYFDWDIPVNWISIYDEDCESFEARVELCGRGGIPNRVQEFEMVDSTGKIIIKKLGQSVQRPQ